MAPGVKGPHYGPMVSTLDLGLSKPLSPETHFECALTRSVSEEPTFYHCGFKRRVFGQRCVPSGIF